MIKIKEFPDPIINFDAENVYIPAEDTFLIIDYLKNNVNEQHFDGLDITQIRNLLDLGTGTGIIAIFFQIVKKNNLKFTPTIYASDILEESINCAKFNEKLNNFNDQIKFIVSDLFESFPNHLKHSFDIIVFNPPYLPSFENINIKKKIDYSWDGGIKGYELFKRFLKEVKYFLNLNNKSYVYFVSSSRIDLNKINYVTKEIGFKREILKRDHMFFEDIILNRLEMI